MDPRKAQERGTVRLSTKGQLVLPRELRQRHDWHVGTRFEIEDRGDHIVLRPLRSVEPTTLDEVVGCAGYSGRALSLEEMEEGIAEGARRGSG